jgi:chromosome segregation ATPase
MKSMAPIIVLAFVTIGFGVGLIVVNNKAHQEKQEADDKLRFLSNTVSSIQASLADQQSVNQTLETNLTMTKNDYSNKLALSDATLRSTEATLEKTKAEASAQAAAATAALAARDKKISELENQNQDLDKQATEMHGKLVDLESMISNTKKKLADSEGDRTLLLSELKRLQAEKADLEKKFNDLADVRDQLRKLRAELAISRRLDWIRRGIYETFNEKGAERLVHPPKMEPAGTNNSLNVELHQNGQAKIVAPPTGK